MRNIFFIVAVIEYYPSSPFPGSSRKSHIFLKNKIAFVFRGGDYEGREVFRGNSNMVCCHSHYCNGFCMFIRWKIHLPIWKGELNGSVSEVLELIYLGPFLQFFSLFLCLWFSGWRRQKEKLFTLLWRRLRKVQNLMHNKLSIEFINLLICIALFGH